MSKSITFDRSPLLFQPLRILKVIAVLLLLSSTSVFAQPQISIQNNGNATVSVTNGSQVEVCFTVANGAVNSPVESMIYDIQPHPLATLQSVVVGGTVVPASSGGTTYVLDANEFATAAPPPAGYPPVDPTNNPNTLQFNETIQVCETWLFTDCAVGAPDMVRDILCDVPACTDGSGQRGVNGVRFGLLIPSISSSWDQSSVTSCFTDGPQPWSVTLTNNGQAIATNLTFSLFANSSQYIDAGSVTYNYTGGSGSMTASSTADPQGCSGQPNRLYYNMDSNASGFELEPGESVIIAFNAIGTCGCNAGGCTISANSFGLGDVRATDPCDEEYGGGDSSTSSYDVNTDGFTEGNLRSFDGTEATHKLNFTRFENDYLWDCPDAVYEFVIDLGNGLDYCDSDFLSGDSPGTTWPNKNVTYVDTQGGTDQVIIRFTASDNPFAMTNSGQPGNGPYSGSNTINEDVFFNLLYKGDCTELPDACTGGPATISQTLFIDKSACCSDCPKEPIYCTESYPTEVVCPACGPCDGASIDSLSFNRVTYGMPDNNQDQCPDDTGSIDLDEIRTDRIIAGDTVRAHIEGNIEGNIDFANLFAKIYMPSIAYIPIGGTITIDDADGGTYTCTLTQQFFDPNDNFIFVTDFSVASLQAFGCSSLPNSFIYDDGDLLNIDIDFQVQEKLVNEGIQIREYRFLGELIGKNAPYGDGSGFSCNNEPGNIYQVNYQREQRLVQQSVGGCSNFAPAMRIDGNFGSSRSTDFDFFPSEYRETPERPTHFYFEEVEGMSLIMIDQISIGRTNNNIDNEQGNTTVPQLDDPINSPYMVFDGTYYIFDYQQYVIDQLGDFPCLDNGAYYTARPRFLPTCETPATTFNYTGKVDEDLNASFFCQSQEQIEITTSNNYTGASVIDLSVTPANVILDQEFYCAEMDIRVTNGNADFMWLFVESVNGSTVVTEVVEDNGTVYTPQNGGMIYIGNTNNGQTRTFDFCFTTNNCSPDSLIVYTGWDCPGYPASFQEASCFESSVINFSTIDGEMEMVLLSPTEPLTFDELCTEVPVELLLSSSRLAHINNLVFMFDLPGGLEYQPGTFEIAYPSTGDPSDYMTIDDPDNPYGNHFEINLTDQSPALAEDGLVGVTDLSRNFFRIRFMTKAGCSFFMGSQLSFEAVALNACGSYTSVRQDQSAFVGLSDRDDILTADVTASDIILEGCGDDSSMIDVEIDITKGTLTSQDSIAVILPYGFGFSDYVAGSNSAAGPPIVKMEDGNQLLLFPANDGLGVGDKIEFSLGLTVTELDVSCGPHDIPIAIFTVKEIACADGGICPDGRFVGGQDNSIVIVEKPNLLINSFDGSMTVNPPNTTGVLDYQMIMENTGDADLDSDITTVLEFWQDVDNDGDVSAADVLIGTDMVNVSIPVGGVTYFEGQTPIEAAGACNIIARINSSVTCSCQDNISFRMKPELEMDFPRFLTTCSNTDLEIGPEPITGFTYQWSAIGAASISAISDPTTTTTIFNGSNPTPNPVNIDYQLRTQIGDCFSYDTVTIRLFPDLSQETNIDACNTGSFTLGTDAVGTDFSWTPSGFLSNPNSPITEVFGLTTDATFVLSYTDEYGCPTTFTANVTVVPCVDPTGLGNYVWKDLNQDGIQDPTEPVMADIPVYLYLANDTSTPVAATITDANGMYYFGPIPAGQYVVGLQPGWAPTVLNAGTDDELDNDWDPATGFTVPVYVGNSEENLSIDIGVLGGYIGDYVWEDTDIDGIQDPGEPVFDFIDVNLYNPGPDGLPDTADDILVGTTQTDANGYYEFDCIIGGDYFVDFDIPDPYIPTFTGSTDDDEDNNVEENTNTPVFTLNPGQRDSTIDAGFYLPVAIGDYVWLDSNLDGQQGLPADEPPFAAVDVSLYNSAGVLLAVVQTDVNGYYRFDDAVMQSSASVGPDSVLYALTDYYVVLGQGSGQFNTTSQQLYNNYTLTTTDTGADASDNDASIANGVDPAIDGFPYIAVTTPAAGNEDMTYDFGLVPPANVGNYVWEDWDNDGLQDAGDVPIEGVQVVLYASDGTGLDTVYTDATGLYLFTNVPIGDYYIGFDISTANSPAVYNPTLQNQGGSDTNDSDADPTTGYTDVFSFTPVTGDDLTWDAGFVPQVDLGDLPDIAAGTATDDYETLSANTGPSHYTNPDLFLGNTVDAELDGQSSTFADGDDLNGDDEDGVTFALDTIIIGGVLEFELSYTNNSGGFAHIEAWIDWNGDGDFNDPFDMIVDTSDASGMIPTSWSIPMPADIFLALNSNVGVRFRISNDNNMTPYGFEDAGEVEDYIIHILGEFDYGDLPDTSTGTSAGNYETDLANNGASHLIIDDLYIGAIVDDDYPTGAQSSTDAEGDDTDAEGDDEDGIILPAEFWPGNTFELPFTAFNGTGETAYLEAWIDWNGDGDFDDPGEMVVDTDDTAGFPANFTVTVPIDAAQNQDLGFRIRLSHDDNMTPYGEVDAGEVEDYLIEVVPVIDFGDLQDTAGGTSQGNYETNNANNGPSHYIIFDEIYLGALVDDELDGQPAGQADGDDNNGTGADDEDGIVFALDTLQYGDDLEFGLTYHNTTGNTAHIEMWVDWNGDGDFDDPQETIIDTNDAGGMIPTSWTIDVPEDLAAFNVDLGVRVRISNDDNMTPYGLILSGEVEDYLTHIFAEFDYGDLPDNGAGTFTNDYETELQNNGPAHVIRDDFYMGNTVDDDFYTDAQPSTLADGDDMDAEGDDEDGLSFLTSLDFAPGNTIVLPFSALNGTGSTAYVEAWIDWNGDGDFDDAGEMIADFDDTAGFPTDITFTIPLDAAQSIPLGFRVRMSNMDNMTPYGLATSGEIEDYLITVNCVQKKVCLPTMIQINK